MRDIKKYDVFVRSNCILSILTGLTSEMWINSFYDVRGQDFDDQDLLCAKGDS